MGIGGTKEKGLRRRARLERPEYNWGYFIALKNTDKTAANVVSLSWSPLSAPSLGSALRAPQDRGRETDDLCESSPLLSQAERGERGGYKATSAGGREKERGGGREIDREEGLEKQTGAYRRRQRSTATHHHRNLIICR